MTHSLPAVVTDTDQNNEIIVRGGGPGENLFVMDHLDIPNPNHFGFVGKGGGPVNLINTEFVERIDFYAGGFPSIYGDKQSSVMNMSLRDGNFKNTDYDLEMSMAGLGFLIEGPIIKNKVSFISSYRKSFIDNLIESAGLTSVPKYSNSGPFLALWPSAYILLILHTNINAHNNLNNLNIIYKIILEYDLIAFLKY